MLLMITIFYVQTQFSSWIEFWHRSTRPQWTARYLVKSSGLIVCQNNFCFGIQMDHKGQDCLRLWLISVLELMLLQNDRFNVLFLCSNLKFSYYFGFYCWKSWTLFVAVESWCIGKAKNCFFSVETSNRFPNFVDLRTQNSMKLPAWILLTKSPLDLLSKSWFSFETDLICVRSILFATHGRKISQCDCASCWTCWTFEQNFTQVSNLRQHPTRSRR